MLVLTRKVGEAIQIDNNVRIVVVSTGKNTVRLGFEADKTVSILREELTKATKPTQSQ